MNNGFEQILKKIKIIFIFVLFFLAITGIPLNSEAQTICTQCDSTLVVSGIGEVKAQPDISTVSVIVTSRGKTASDAINTNASSAQKLINVLSSAGIAQKDIQTQNVNVFPVYKDKINSQNATNNVIAYEASNSITVTVRKVHDTGSIIDLISNTGDYTISGINFSLEDDKSEKTEALDKAVNDAKDKANAIAKSARTKIIGIKKINVENSFTANRFADAGIAASPTPVQPGDLTVSASVSVEYLIEK